MKKTVALIHPKIDFEENYPCSWIPFSILSIGSALPLSIFEVLLFDEHCMSKQDIYDALHHKDILMVGISIMTGGGQIGNGLEIATELHKEHPEAKIVFGGPHVNVQPYQTIQSNLVDFAICGTGQVAFTQLALALLNGTDYSSIAGLFYKHEGKVIIPKSKKACIANLTPYNFDLLEVNPYIKFDSTISDRTLNYIASQGCPYGCNFCYECSYGKKYYQLHYKFIQRDIKTYAENFCVNGIKFYDADFFVNKKQVDSIVEYLANYDLHWAASIHPNDILRHQTGGTNSLLDSISKSRCTRLLMGMESGSNRVLHEIINKRANAEDYISIAEAIANYGILGSYTFMVGFPGESQQEIEETFSLVRHLWALNVPLETKVHIYLPYPGTPLYEESIQLGHNPPTKLEEWSKYNYYKAMTPWTNSELESKITYYTHMIDKKR